MRANVSKRILGAVVSAVVLTASVPFTASAADRLERNVIGGLEYELWNQNDEGDVEFEPGESSFTLSWNDVENFIADMGINYDSQKKNYKYFNNVSFSYDLEFTPKGNAFFGAYGWTRTPMVEYFIVDGWGSWRPSPSSDSQLLGTTVVNGHEYEVFKTNYYNQPGIDGPATVQRYWSVRSKNTVKNNTTNHVSGCIDISKHFDSWGVLGLDTSGTLYNAVFEIEGYRSSGSAKLNSIKMGEGRDSSPLTVYKKQYGHISNTSDLKECYLFMHTFDQYIDDWDSRDFESLKKSSVSYNVIKLRKSKIITGIKKIL